MTVIPRIGTILCIWAACLAIVQQPVLAAEPLAAEPLAAEPLAIQDGIPMKSIPMHLMPRSYAGRKRTLGKFQPKDSIGLRFVEAEKYEYLGACHHVDMNVELKTDDGSKNIQSLNPFAFQGAVKSFSCSRVAGSTSSQLDIELDAEFADQARRWNLAANKIFALVIPHDFVDLKKNKACYDDLDATSKQWTQTHPLETVVKLVKNPRFLNSTTNTLSLSVAKTDIWSQMNRAQSVRIYHKPIEQMIPQIFGKRSIAEQEGPMWDFDHDMTAATRTIAAKTESNVNANLDSSSVKGYAQADMNWKQTCIKNIFTGKMNCANWGISSSKISGMTQVNHQSQISVKSQALSTANANAPPMLTLTQVNLTTPSFDLMPAISLLGFSVPGVFDMGASVNLAGSVTIDILVKATKDLLINSGTTTSCPWIIDWNGSLTTAPTIQFGSCTLPGTPKLISDPGSILHRRSTENLMYFGVDPASHPDMTLATMTSSKIESRETAFVSIGMTVSPALSLGLKVFGINTLAAGLSAPVRLDVNSNWDTAATSQCPANNIALCADGSASLQLSGGFFGFSKSMPLVQTPTLNSPSVCIPV
ncbi:hypothetical protein BGZ99_000788 [Dissophora globulifera]|uniref:Uncharacterized protein n=1 Tax=Dissophora globulifera TaxID=979702 RepID=A0A9P6RR71_9FUNG|nr:hypothetical protein BGZ99_000788 [Dissophora globulifera]